MRFRLVLQFFVLVDATILVHCFIVTIMLISYYHADLRAVWQDVGSVGSPRVRLMPCLHFVRQMVQRHLRQVTIKENDVLSALKFSKGEAHLDERNR